MTNAAPTAVDTSPPRWLGWPRRGWLRLGGWLLLLIALRLAVVPAEGRDPASAAELRSAVSAASDWMQRSQAVSGEGRYLYLYDAARDIAPDDYNEVRHAGVTMALFQAAGRDRNLEALAAADRAVEWMTAHLYRRDGWAALADEAGARAKVGSTALMVVALAERRLATGDPRHDALMRELGAFLAAMQRADGGFLVAWEIHAGEPDRAGTSRYYPGEALWALALLHEAFPGEGWDEHARAASSFITTRRDEVEDVRFRPLPDHWAAYGLAEMAEWGLSEPGDRVRAPPRGDASACSSASRHSASTVSLEAPDGCSATRCRPRPSAPGSRACRRSGASRPPTRGWRTCAPRSRSDWRSARACWRGGRSTQARRSSTRTPIACAAPG